MKKTKNKQNNQRSFYFNEYNQNLITEKKSGVLNISHDRIYSLFFIFLCLIFIFATKIFFISLKSYDSKSQFKNHSTYKTSRNDIVDDGKIKKEILKNSPEKNEDFFIVPKVVE